MNMQSITTLLTMIVAARCSFSTALSTRVTSSILIGGATSQFHRNSNINNFSQYSRPVAGYASTLKMSTNDSEDGTKIRQTTGPSTSAGWDSRQSLVGSLLEKTTSRAFRTLSENSASSTNEDTVENPNVDNVIDATISRSLSTLDKKEESVSDDTKQSSNANSASLHQDKRTYLGNPAVTPTALAHSLWKSTIIPYQDTIIDATCGNGKDCLALAKMLFPHADDTLHDDQNASPKPQLIGLDIQSRAIDNTQRSLLSSLSSDVYYNHVSILQQSHEHLMNVPADTQSVGLVCYNLGYLPGGTTDNYKETQTQTQTTLNSITDASLLLRVGGLLSVMTYPASNLEESRVVEHFVEGLAMLTTRDAGGWRGYLDSIPEYDNDAGHVRDIVSQAVERIVRDGSKKQTWRVFVHKSLGRPLSPVLVTAMRIK